MDLRHPPVGPRLKLPRTMGGPGLDFQTWETLTSEFQRTKSGGLGFIVSQVSYARLEPPATSRRNGLPQ